MALPAPRLLLGVIALAVATVACVDAGSYGAGGRYPSPEVEAPPAVTVTLVSAHLSRAATPRPQDPGGPALVEPSEAELDRLLLVFSRPIDPLTLDPRGFAVLRGDGRRVSAVRATLAPADEGDENHSVTLLGYFVGQGVGGGGGGGGGGEAQTPVTVHILGEMFAESGEPLRGLSAEIVGEAQADRPVLLERLAADASRCPGAKAVLRSYWSDGLAGVGDDDLTGIVLRFADGSSAAPIDFDDQAWREGDEPGLGPVDDNVLDLCLDREQAVVEVGFAAGLFLDGEGHETAAARIPL